MRGSRNRIAGLALVAVFGAFVAVSAAPQAQLKPELALKAAMDKETIDGDLAGAIAQYKALADKYAKSDRGVAAEALLRLADAYQKLGDTQARVIYERVVREYPDQQAAAAARARLDAGQSGTGPGTNDVSANWQNDERPPLSLALSADGRRGTFIDAANELAVRDMQTGQVRELTDLAHRGGSIDGSAISRDNQYVAYASAEKNGVKPGVRILPLSAAPVTTPRLLNEGMWTNPQEWSADGKQLLVIYSPDKAPDEVALLSVADGRLTKLPRPDGYIPERALLSPDQQVIALETTAAADQRRQTIFLLSTNGTPAVLAVDTASVPAADHVLVGWSADGRQLVFISDRPGSRGVGLWALPVANGRPAGEPILLRGGFTGNPIALTSAGDLFYEMVTPSGTRETTMFVAAIDPANGTVVDTPQPVADEATALNVAPRWSSDGRSFVYFTHRGSRTMISIQSTDTGVVREIPWKLGYEWGYDLSPSGRALVCRAIDPTGAEGIFVVDLQTGAVRPVVMKDGPAAEGHGVGNYSPLFWTDDQVYFRRVAFDTPQAPGREIVRDLATGQEQVLWESPLRKFAVLLPDRNLRLAINGPTILVENVATGESRELFRATQPNAFDGGDTVRWTPDSKALIAKVAGDAPNERSLWRIPIDGSKPHKLALGRTESSIRASRFIRMASTSRLLLAIRSHPRPRR